MLTRQQATLLHFIAEYQAQNDGVSPSFDEMAAGLNLRSKSGIHRIITGLEERGFIVRRPHLARAIAVLRLPEPMTSTPARDLDLVIAGMVGQYGGKVTLEELLARVAKLEKNLMPSAF